VSETLVTDFLAGGEPVEAEFIRRVPATGYGRAAFGTTIVVPPGEVAILIHDGRATDVLAEGQHRLTQHGTPRLAEAVGLRDLEAGESFLVALLVVSRQRADRCWGTRNPLLLRNGGDTAYRLRSHGSYAFRVADPVRFAAAVHDEQGIESAERLDHLLREIIVAEIQTTLDDQGLTIPKLPGAATQMVEVVRERLHADLARSGIELIELRVESIVVPDVAREALRGGDPGGSDSEMPDPSALPLVELASEIGVGTLLSRMHVQTVRDDGDEPGASQAGADDAQPPDQLCCGCDRSVPAEARFCPWCGHSFDGDDGEQS
jgi:membrane protease subunit (stomatin/prohibitin family)